MGGEKWQEFKRLKKEVYLQWDLKQKKVQYCPSVNKLQILFCRYGSVPRGIIVIQTTNYTNLQRVKWILNEFLTRGLPYQHGAQILPQAGET